MHLKPKKQQHQTNVSSLMALVWSIISVRTQHMFTSSVTLNCPMNISISYSSCWHCCIYACVGYVEHLYGFYRILYPMCDAFMLAFYIKYTLCMWKKIELYFSNREKLFHLRLKIQTEKTQCLRNSCINTKH